MGGDSIGIDDAHSFLISRERKVFRKGEYLFGVAFLFRGIQLLKYKFAAPPKPSRQSPLKFMARDFVDALKDCFKADGCLEQVRRSKGKLLVGCYGRLFLVDVDDFQVLSSRRKFEACGAGGDFALGVLAATKRMEPRRRILTALRAAEEMCAAVRPPFVVRSLRIRNYRRGG